ncbi:hypothetical protein C6A37_09270, partial [Desulfobacteraceae bacterium SEEP-SAG9]
HRFFSCQDLSLDVLVKILLPISNVRTWKIEGRKKGPHYVFCTVKAYRMLRDQGQDPQIKKNGRGSPFTGDGSSRNPLSFFTPAAPGPCRRKQANRFRTFCGQNNGIETQTLFRSPGSAFSR